MRVTFHSTTGQCLKHVLVVSNIIAILLGVACVACGLWVAIARRPFAVLAGSQLFVSVAYLLVVLGTAVIISLAVAFYALRNELRCLLSTSAVAMVLLSLMLVITGIMGFVFRDQMEHALRFEMESSMKHFYGESDWKDITTAWDMLQIEAHCCAMFGPDELPSQRHDSYRMWRSTKWFMRAAPDQPEALLFPRSCCISASARRSKDGCSKQVEARLDDQRSIADIVYLQGCYMPLKRILLQCSFMTAVSGITTSVFLLVPAVFCVVVAKVIQK